MPTPEQRFKDAATQDFGGNEEQRFRAFELLNAQTRSVDAEVLETAAVVLEKSPAVRQWIRWSFYGLSILVGLWIILTSGKQVLEDRAYIYAPGIFSSGLMAPEPSYHRKLGGDLSHEENLILFGDMRHPKRSQQRHALWMLDSENPAYYIEYAMAFREDYGSLPSDFLERSAEIDPDNGWYLFVQSGLRAEDAVQIKPVPKVSRPRGRRLSRKSPKGRARGKSSTTPAKKPLPEYVVADQTKYDDALAGFYQSAAMSKFQSHQAGLFKKRVSLLPKGGDSISRLIPFSYMASMQTYVFHVMNLAKIVNTEALRCKDEKDAEGLKKLIAAWDTMGRRMNKDTFTLVDALLAKSWTERSFGYFSEAARECSLPVVAARFEALDKDAQERREKRSQSYNVSQLSEDLQKKGGMLHGMAMPMVEKQIDFPEKIKGVDLMPGRLTDHSFVGRILSATAWLFMVVCVGVVYVYRFRYGGIFRKLSTRFMALSKPVDMLWILGGGVILPLAYYWVINRHSPWSVRHDSVHYYSFIQPMGQFAGMLALMLILSLLIVQLRVGKNVNMLGYKFAKWPWVFVLLSVIALPCFGMLVGDHGESSLMMKFALGSLGVTVLYVLLEAVRGCFGKQKYALKRVLVSRLLVLPFALAALLMAILVPVHHQEEYYWVSQDVDFSLSIEEPGFTGYEYRVTQQARKELAAIMGWDD